MKDSMPESAPPNMGSNMGPNMGHMGPNMGHMGPNMGHMGHNMGPNMGQNMGPNMYGGGHHHHQMPPHSMPTPPPPPSMNQHHQTSQDMSNNYQQQHSFQDEGGMANMDLGTIHILRKHFRMTTLLTHSTTLKSLIEEHACLNFSCSKQKIPPCSFINLLGKKAGKMEFFSNPACLFRSALQLGTSELA